MKLIHLSDTHGSFPCLPEGDIIVHSGDFFPDGRKHTHSQRRIFQTQWLQDNISQMKDWLGGRTFVFCQGNHDFIDIENVCKPAGVAGVDITNRVVKLEGLRLYGFPFMPYHKGRWNNERYLPEMTDEVQAMSERVRGAGGIDILVAHVPLYGVLDLCNDGNRCGNMALNSALTYGKLHAKVFLCGHVHENHGQAQELGMQISQAATAIHTLDLE